LESFGNYTALESFGNNTAKVPGVFISRGTTRVVMPGGPPQFPDDDKDDDKNLHEKGGKTFTRVYANSLALEQISKDKPAFPVGSMIVREKLLKAEDTTPELVTVMLKREKGFSRKTSDWEYFVIDGALSNVKLSEKGGSCSKCHIQATETDMVFKTYLK
jgi:hypothetical protein